MATEDKFPEIIPSRTTVKGAEAQFGCSSSLVSDDPAGQMKDNIYEQLPLRPVKPRNKILLIAFVSTIAVVLVTMSIALALQLKRTTTHANANAKQTENATEDILKGVLRDQIAKSGVIIIIIITITITTLSIEKAPQKSVRSSLDNLDCAHIKKCHLFCFLCSFFWGGGVGVLVVACV